MHMRHPGAPSDADELAPVPPQRKARRIRLLPALSMVVLLLGGIAAAGWSQRGGGETSAPAATPSTAADFTAQVAAGGGPVAQGGTAQTKYGPLSPADRDFLVKVRLAGLWEKPAGEAGLKRSQNPLIQEAAKHLVDGHTDLDAKVIAIAQEFGVPLPAEPNEPTQEWLDEMDSATSEQAFEDVFVNRLRAAHGAVFGLLASIRANTRNTMVRSFAQYSMTVVLDHITVLEKTGLVDWNDMESPSLPDGVAGNAPVSDTQWGPLAAFDRDFLQKVRQAGLWEKPSGLSAQQRSQNALVKTAGQHLIDGHADLDAKVIAIGQMMNVELPTQPSELQQGWMNEMKNAATPADFDSVFANRLRAAHGKVYELLAKERTGSKNAMMRKFAEYSMTVVLDHMTVLEQTKLVDFDQLPENPQPTAVGLKERNVNWIFIGLIMFGAVAISIVVMRELYGKR